ncbi:hypothetical protein GOV05_00460 [Candidatus Woesearchaeota archaeon]|nr:hypothetical protein [Candidatus Woesearchaeota archaeon]
MSWFGKCKELKEEKDWERLRKIIVYLLKKSTKDYREAVIKQIKNKNPPLNINEKQRKEERDKDEKYFKKLIEDLNRILEACSFFVEKMKLHDCEKKIIERFKNNAKQAFDEYKKTKKLRDELEKFNILKELDNYYLGKRTNHPVYELKKKL